MSPCAPSLLPVVLLERAGPQDVHLGRCELLHPWGGGRQGCCTHRMRALHSHSVEPAWAVWGCVSLAFWGASAPVTGGFCICSVGLGPSQALWGSCSSVEPARVCARRAARDGFPQCLTSISLALGSVVALLVAPGLGGSIT